MRRTHLSHRFVEFIPELLDEGVLYISQRYGTAVHKCCCGCGEEVVTPLTPTDWSLRMEGGSVTLYPSVGNWGFACRSHYWIRQSKVVWAGQMSQRQIERGRALDRAAKEAYFAAANREKQRQLQQSPTGVSAPQPSHAQRLPSRLWLVVKRWWAS